MSTSYFMLKLIKRKKGRLNQKNNNTKKEKPEVISECDQDSTKCRICLKQGCISIYSKDSSYDLSEAIRAFGTIDIREDDVYPKYLCDACHSLLQGAMLFRKSAMQTDKILRENLVKSDSNYCNYIDEQSVESNDDMSSKINCKLCKLDFFSWDEYVTHKSSRQHRNVRIQCPVCFGLITSRLYKKHLAIHQSASHLICEVCGKLYRKDNLVRHLQLHSNELPYQCQICPYRGRFTESLKIHMRTHSGDKPFSCNECHLRFITRSNLNRHLLTHKKDRPFKCVECNRSFYSKRDLDVHFKSDHIGIKDFSCKLCGNKYGNRKALMRHELRVHKRNKLAKGRQPLYLQAEYKKNNITE